MKTNYLYASNGSKTNPNSIAINAKTFVNLSIGGAFSSELKEKCIAIKDFSWSNDMKLTPSQKSKYYCHTHTNRQKIFVHIHEIYTSIDHEMREIQDNYKDFYHDILCFDFEKALNIMLDKLIYVGGISEEDAKIIRDINYSEQI